MNNTDEFNDGNGIDSSSVRNHQSDHEETSSKQENDHAAAAEKEDDEDEASDASSSDDDNDSSSGDESNDEDDDEKNSKKDGLSDYERLRLERIARNEARLATLGLTEGGTLKDHRKKNPGKQRRANLLEGPRRQLPGRSAKVQLYEASRKEKYMEEEKNPDACFKCQSEEGGEFLFLD